MRLFAMPFMYKMISLPRQARDKHRKNSKKSGVLCREFSRKTSAWYVQEFQRRAGVSPSYHGPASFAAACALCAAIEAADSGRGSLEPTDVAAALGDLSLQVRNTTHLLL